MHRLGSGFNVIRAELELPSSSARVYAYHFATMWQDFSVGHLDDAETAANTLLRLGDDLKQLTYHNEARVLLGRIAQLRGEYDAAREQLRRVIPSRVQVANTVHEDAPALRPGM